MSATATATPALDAPVTIRTSAAEMHRQFRRGRTPAEYALFLRRDTDFTEPVAISWTQYRVLSPSGETYTVILTTDEQSCTCTAGQKDGGAWGHWDKCWHRAYAMNRMLFGPRRPYDAAFEARHRAGVAAYVDAATGYVDAMDRIAETYEDRTGDSWRNLPPEDVRGPAELTEYRQVRGA